MGGARRASARVSWSAPERARERDGIDPPTPRFHPVPSRATSRPIRRPACNTRVPWGPRLDQRFQAPTSSAEGSLRVAWRTGRPHARFGANQIERCTAKMLAGESTVGLLSATRAGPASPRVGNSGSRETRPPWADAVTPSAESPSSPSPASGARASWPHAGSRLRWRGVGSTSARRRPEFRRPPPFSPRRGAAGAPG